jgi:parvulin-like peptidyl-prolyl isomerase
MKLAATLALPLLLLGPAALAEEAAPLVLARVDEEPIDERELVAEFVERHGGHAKFLLAEPEIRRFLELVIDRRLLLQEAYRLELDELPAIVAATADFAAKKAAERLVRDETEGRAEPTEEEIRAAWEKETTTLYRVQHIVVPTRREAEALHERIAAGADMAQLAQEHSIARSRAFSGMMAVIGWGALPPEWERVVFALEPGAISAPFRGPEGWEIARLVDRARAERPDFDAARSRIAGILRQRKLEERKRALREEMWAKYGARWTAAAAGPSETLRELSARAPETPLATWNGGALNAGPALAGIDFAALAGVAEDEPGEALRTQIGERVDDALYRREARARGLERDPEIAFEVRRFRERLMEGALYADHVLRGLEVSDADVRSFYEERPARYSDPERRRVAHLVAASREEALALRARLVAGESFEELARSVSTDDTTAHRGGDLGWITPASVPVEFESVLRLGLGEVSEPIRSTFGWHVVKVKEIEPGDPHPFAEVAERVRADVERARRSERRATWVAKLRAVSEIEVDDEAIRALAAKSDPTLEPPPPQHGPPS